MCYSFTNEEKCPNCSKQKQCLGHCAPWGHLVGNVLFILHMNKKKLKKFGIELQCEQSAKMSSLVVMATSTKVYPTGAFEKMVQGFPKNTRSSVRFTSTGLILLCPYARRKPKFPPLPFSWTVCLLMPPDKAWGVELGLCAFRSLVDVDTELEPRLIVTDPTACRGPHIGGTHSRIWSHLCFQVTVVTSLLEVRKWGKSDGFMTCFPFLELC